MNLKLHLEQLDLAAQELDTGPGPRRGEINNVRCSIRLTIETINAGDLDFLKELMPLIVEIKGRINRMANDETHCGKHQHLNN